MLFYLVRHGDPIYDPDSLTPLGHEQAKAVAKRLLLYGIDEVYASTSVRAQQTAQPLCDLLKKEMTLCDWANESHAWADLAIPRADGAYTWVFFEKEYVKKFNSPEVLALGNQWHTHPYFADSKLKHGLQRINQAVDEFFLTLGYRHDRARGCYHADHSLREKSPNRVAFFAHQGFGLAFLSSVLDIPYPLICTRFDLSHSSTTAIYFPDEADGIVFPKILQLSNDSHLYREGILTGYHNQINV